MVQIKRHDCTLSPTAVLLISDLDRYGGEEVDRPLTSGKGAKLGSSPTIA